MSRATKNTKGFYGNTCADAPAQEVLQLTGRLVPFLGFTLASAGHLLPYRRAAHRILSHLLPAKEPAAAYITFSTLRPNETVKISPSKSGDSADMADSQPQSKSPLFTLFFKKNVLQCKKKIIQKEINNKIAT